MFTPILFEQPHQRPMKRADHHLQHAQQTRRAQRPAIAQQRVVLLLNANARHAPQHIQVVGQFLELHQLDLPRTVLLLDDGFQGNCGVAMPAAGIVKHDVNFLRLRAHSAEFATFMS